MHLSLFYALFRKNVFIPLVLDGEGEADTDIHLKDHATEHTEQCTQNNLVGAKLQSASQVSHMKVNLICLTHHRCFLLKK